MKWLKRILYFILFLVLAGIITFLFVNESLPKGTPGQAADKLARKMQTATNLQAWKKTGAVKFTFSGSSGGGRTTLWDKTRHLAKVSWGDGYEVLVNINQKKGVARQNRQIVKGNEGQKLVIKAWKIWVNDSFWLNPIAKAFDPGTSRHLVDVGNGQQGVMVSYNSGGDTPGDAYLWLLDKNGLPSHWKLWVSIIPIGGIKFSWEHWITLSTGAKVATFHSGLIDIKLTDVKGTTTLKELTNGKDVFTELTNN